MPKAAQRKAPKRKASPSARARARAAADGVFFPKPGPHPPLPTVPGLTEKGIDEALRKRRR